MDRLETPLTGGYDDVLGISGHYEQSSHLWVSWVASSGSIRIVYLIETSFRFSNYSYHLHSVHSIGLTGHLLQLNQRQRDTRMLRCGGVDLVHVYSDDDD